MCITKVTLSDEDAALMTNFTIKTYVDLNENGVGLKQKVNPQL